MFIYLKLLKVNPTTVELSALHGANISVKSIKYTISVLLRGQHVCTQTNDYTYLTTNTNSNN